MMNAINIRTIIAQARNRGVASQSSSRKPSFNSHKKTIKLQTIHRVPSFKLKDTNKISGMVPILQTKRRENSRSASHPTYGMNNHFLVMRKESHLNSCFNARKTKLKELTKQNKKIYVRLNSQKSIYSSRDLDKSYEQNRQLQSRLSQSKLSRRSNLSRSSSRKDSGKGKRFESNKKIPMQIKAANINNAQSQDLDHFRALFVKDVNKPPRPPKPTANKYQTAVTRKENLSQRKGYIQQKLKLREIDEGIASNQPCGLLHKIAEQMFVKPRNAVSKKNSLVFRSRKILNF